MSNLAFVLSFSVNRYYMIGGNKVFNFVILCNEKYILCCLKYRFRIISILMWVLRYLYSRNNIERNGNLDHVSTAFMIKLTARVTTLGILLIFKLLHVVDRVHIVFFSLILWELQNCSSSVLNNWDVGP